MNSRAIHYGAGRIPDVALLTSDLEAQGATGAAGKLLGVLDDRPGVWNAAEYARRVADLADRRWAIATLERAAHDIFSRDGDWREHVARAGVNLAILDERGKAESQTAHNTAWTAAELLASKFPEPRWAVPDLVPVGFSFLAGRPKVGKSWLAMQISIAVGTGGIVLNRRVKQGKVLYIALEDNGRRLQQRTVKQMMPATAAIDFHTTWRAFADGGAEDLQSAITEHGYTLTVLDTLARVLGRVDHDDMGAMTAILAPLQEMAMQREVAILAIDHHRKSAGRDANPIDDIAGSTAKGAVSDAALGLWKEQGKRGAVLKVTGREVEWQDLSLSWDPVTCCWHLEGTAEGVELRGRRGLVLSVLQESEDSLTAGEVAKRCGMQRENVLPLLNDLVREGHVTREPKRGKEQPYRTV